MLRRHATLMLSAYYDVLGPVKQDGAWFQVRIEKRKTLVSMDGAWLATMGITSAGLFTSGILFRALISILIGFFLGVFVVIFFLQFLLYRQHDQLLTVSSAEGMLTLEEMIDDETTKIVEQLELQSLGDIKIVVDRGRSRFNAHYHLRLVRPDRVISVFSSPDRKSASLLGNLIINAKNKART